MITVDAAHSGVRDFARRMNVQPPPPLTTSNLPTQFVLTDLPILLANAPNWNDITWLVAHCPVPVLLKGILRPDDAKHALAIGCAGVVVSNHGQRVLADSVAVAQVLPSIRQAIPNAILLADGGVMSGSDIAKLRALGADMVGVGRLVIYGLALAGALGTAHVLRLLQEEWQITAALTGEHGLVAKNRLGGSTKTV
ncbi:L-lactate dehydrogenase [cytochrome] [Moraxella atlantae]|uniref:L-lactate dehydrogenase [cytochrome] n=1 Tax=Faucicola atlantae TaxID=34059 RepID=A0A378Q0F5_9GAMM|nr:L-lactate dehydrogenase [cytochrome] [Moraxella atlantae]